VPEPDHQVVDSVSPVRHYAGFILWKKTRLVRFLVYFDTPTPGAQTLQRYSILKSTRYNDLFRKEADIIRKGSVWTFIDFKSDLNFLHCWWVRTNCYSMRYNEPDCDYREYDCKSRVVQDKWDAMESWQQITYITKRHACLWFVWAWSRPSLGLQNWNLCSRAQRIPPMSLILEPIFWQDWEKKGHMEIIWRWMGKKIKQLDQDIGIIFLVHYSRGLSLRNLLLFFASKGIRERLFRL